MLLQKLQSNAVLARHENFVEKLPINRMIFSQTLLEQPPSSVPNISALLKSI